MLNLAFKDTEIYYNLVPFYLHFKKTSKENDNISFLRHITRNKNIIYYMNVTFKNYLKLS